MSSCPSLGGGPALDRSTIHGPDREITCRPVTPEQIRAGRAAAEVSAWRAAIARGCRAHQAPYPGTSPIRGSADGVVERSNPIVGAHIAEHDPGEDARVGGAIVDEPSASRIAFAPDPPVDPVRLEAIGLVANKGRDPLVAQIAVSADAIRTAEATPSDEHVARARRRRSERIRRRIRRSRPVEPDQRDVLRPTAGVWRKPERVAHR